MSAPTKIKLNTIIEERVNELIEETVRYEVSQYTHIMTKRVSEQIEGLLHRIITQQIKKVDFPQGSIHHTSINFTGFGKEMIHNIEETNLPGVEDFSKKVELTLIENGVVVENTLFAKNIEAENIILSENFYNKIEERVKNIIPDVPNIDHLNKGYKDLQNKINQKTKEISVNQLEVSGESILSDVLYTTPGNKRVGINTMEPGSALTVWDQEAEVSIGKHEANTSFIGTTRNQNLNIVTNNKTAIGIDKNGTVSIDKIRLLGRDIGESDNVPGHKGSHGDIYLNKNIQQGTPIGWICIEGTKWSAFGNVE